jgi:hypothetical protein
VTAAFVQQAAGPSGTAALTSPATGGNCLIACLQAYGASSIGGVTSAASPDRWVAVKTVSGGGQVLAVWIDPDCANGSSTVNFTAPGASMQNICVFEFSGVGSSPAVDVFVTNLLSASPNTRSWTTNATAATAHASDVQIGVLAGNSSSLLAVAGASSPWNSQGTGQRTGGVYAEIAAGYQIPGTTGTVTYTAAASTTGAVWAGIAVAITPGGGAGAGASGSFMQFFA